MVCLVLPPGYRHLEALEACGVACTHEPDAALRLGIINLMPAAESYELMLLSALAAQPGPQLLVQPVWIRLASHGYASSDRAHIAQNYRTFAEANRPRPLSGLILTGAPVEELPFEQVRYWNELGETLLIARATIPSTLGLCWGGLALARLLGIEKESYASKLFGVYPLSALTPDSLLTDAPLFCPQSRHSGISDRTLEQAAREQRVRLLAHGEGGYSLLRSGDGRFVMHLGHPEYTWQRLVLEYERDRAAGRHDVTAPRHLDLQDPARSFRSHGPGFFARWLEELSAARG